MVRDANIEDFDQIAITVSASDLARMDDTRWRDDCDIKVEDVRAMAKRLHEHGYIPNIDRLLMIAVGGSLTAGFCKFTREA